MPVLLVECEVECDSLKGLARVDLVDSLLESGVDFILGNDLLKGEEIATTVFSTVTASIA